MIEIKHSDMSYNLGGDIIAVDLNGNILARAASAEGCHRAAPDAHAYLTAKDIGQPETGPLDGAGVDYAAAEAAVEQEPGPIGSGVTLTSIAHPEGEPVDENADLNPESLETGEYDDETGKVTWTKPAPKDATAAVADGSAFDHDKDGKSGGSQKGVDSTAHKGAENRKRKPGGK